jgi:hypothetical protein
MALLLAKKAHHGPFLQWLLDHETAAVWLTGVSTGILAIGVLLAWYALFDAKRTRHAQLVSDFSLRWDSQEIIEAVGVSRNIGSDGLFQLATDLFGPGAARPADPQKAADWSTASKWCNLLETVGVMVEEKNLPRRTVFRMWGGNIRGAWTLWAKCAEVQREDLKDHDILQYFQKLAGAMEIERQNEERRRKTPGPIGAAILLASRQT